MPSRSIRHARRRLGAVGLLGLLMLAAAVVAETLVDRAEAPASSPSVPDAVPGPEGTGTGTDTAAEAEVRAPAAGATPPAAPLTGAARVVAENARLGNPEWREPVGDTRRPASEGFADRVSAQQGETVRLFVTSAPSYEAIAYRLGYYGAAGARRIWSSGPLQGVVQPPCPVHSATNMVDCSHWAATISITLDDTWPPGQYVIKLVPAEGAPGYIPFVVRDDASHSDVLIISSVTTLQAYNTWGGHGFYTKHGLASTVSFDRPLDPQWMRSAIYGDTQNLARMAESLGLDVSYTTNIDQHERPELLRNHRVVVSGFHDEYYSPEMRGALETARDGGVNLLFLGANAIYRRVYFEPSPLGTNRRQVSYLGTTENPLNGPMVWREGPSHQPESALIGMSYECDDFDLRADMVIVDGAAWMFADTNVTSGQRWPGVVMQEYDRITSALPSPPNVQVLAHSPVVCDGQASFSNMTYYTAPSNAGVLAVGTVGFEHRLGQLCPPEYLTAAFPTCQLRKMVANVLTEFARAPAGVTHPSTPNRAQLGI